LLERVPYVTIACEHDATRYTRQQLDGCLAVAVL